jgi:hypothetical protein
VISRADSLGEVKDQEIHPILVSPKVPGRFYFIFGMPIETRGTYVKKTALVISSEYLWTWPHENLASLFVSGI